MVELLKFFNSNPVAANIIAVSLLLVVVMLILIFIAAFVQGREISFYPPKIGGKLNPEKPKIHIPKDTDEVKYFESSEVLMRHVIKRLSQAKVQIDDISWNPYSGLGHGMNTTQEVLD